MKANKAVSIFNFNNQKVRTILINNEPFFCLKDVCEILGVRNSRHALSRLTPKGVVKSDTLTKGGTQSLNFINEANLYKVIFKSVKPEAIKFEEWVTSEILPSIRKTGSYNVNNSPYHLVNKHLTVPSYNINIVTTGVRTQPTSVPYATNDIVASLNTGFPIFVYSGRAKNTIPEREIIPLNLVAEFLTSRVINNSSKKEQLNMENSNCTNGVSNQIISISKHSFNGKETNTVNARELYSFLESKQQFADWIKNRIKQYEFQENLDFVRFHKKMKANNATLIEYYLTITMAKELAMVENNSKGKQARKYFIECERKLLELSPYHLVNKHSTGFNNINTEAELVHAAKANLSSVVNTLEELNIANIVYRKGRWVYNYALNKREYIKKETLKDYLQHQVDILSRAFNIMYQPYYKEIINLEHSKKYKELQKFLAKRGGCKCCY